MLKQVCNTLFQTSKLITTYTNVRNNGFTMSSALNIEAERIVWMDLEMTGLDVEKCYIMELACIITDNKLNIVAEGPDIIINHPPEILDNMNEWCTKQHGKTGLTDACKLSKMSLKEAENAVLQFIKEYVQPGMSPLAGNSVYMDRLFLTKYMPDINNYLHYRLIDVSTIKELCRRWNPSVYHICPKKQFLHRSLQDIKESIEELKWYRDNFFKITSE